MADPHQMQGEWEAVKENLSEPIGVVLRNSGEDVADAVWKVTRLAWTCGYATGYEHGNQEAWRQAAECDKDGDRG